MATQSLAKFSWLATLSAVAVTVATAAVAWQLTYQPCGEFLQVVSSSEKSGILAKMAQSYNDEKRRFPKPLPICVQVHSLTSGAAQQALAKGWDPDLASELIQPDKTKPAIPAPDVWTPSTTMWVKLLHGTPVPDGAAPSAQPTRSASAPPPLQMMRSEDYPVLARSLVVVAMPKEKAAKVEMALDKGEGFTWKSLQLSRTEAGGSQSWGTPGTLLRHGKPEWDHFWFRKDNPTTSTSGLAATIATYRAAFMNAGLDFSKVADHFGNDNLARDERVNLFVRQVEAGIDPGKGYDFDATEMMKELAVKDDQARADGGGWLDASAVIVQEQFVYLYNANKLPFEDGDVDRPRETPKQPLVAFYPADGTMVMDHPYVKRAGLPGAKDAVAEDFLTYIRVHRSLLTDAGFRDEAGVLGSAANDVIGRTQPGSITEIDFPDAAGIQAIQRSWQALRKRASLWMLMDDSGTMNDPTTAGGPTRLKASQDAAASAVNASLGQYDKVELRLFPGDADPRGPKPYRPVFVHGPVADKAELRARINTDIPDERRNQTPLYANILAAYQDARKYLDLRHELNRRTAGDEIVAVVVLTDGANDTLSRTVAERQARETQMIDEIKKKEAESIDQQRGQIRIYVVVFGQVKTSLAVLEAVADASGGAVFDASTGGDLTINRAFSQALSVV